MVQYAIQWRPVQYTKNVQTIQDSSNVLKLLYKLILNRATLSRQIAPVNCSTASCTFHDSLLMYIVRQLPAVQFSTVFSSTLFVVLKTSIYNQHRIQYMLFTICIGKQKLSITVQLLVHTVFCQWYHVSGMDFAL
jgi:hypothetical protein